MATQASVRLDCIVFDAGTQVRAGIDESVVAQYAERMTEGDQFPPVIVFHDGNHYYLGDGFHRALAAQRIQWREIDADVHPGTKTDALWFALGANKTNGKQMTAADKSHAVAMALRQWPEKMQREIANQVGCHPSLVSEVYRKTTASEPVLRGRDLQTHHKRESVRELIQVGGMTAEQIAEKAKVGRSTVTEVRAEMGLSRTDTSKAAVTQRRKDIQSMAERGFTSRQIAAHLSLDISTVTGIAKKEGVVIHADHVVGKRSARHDANRIVSQMVMDAENLTADVDLIDFSQLDPTQLSAWLTSLTASRKSLGAFIRRLEQEQKKHGEAA